MGGRDKKDAASIKAKIEEMANLQSYMHLHSGGAGTKIIFILTSIPNEWALAGERLQSRSPLINDAVDQLFQVSSDSRRPTESSNPILELSRLNKDPESGGHQEWKTDSHRDERATLESSHKERLTIDEIRYTFQMSRSASVSYQDHIRNYHKNEQCWIPMVDALTHRYSEFVELLDDRITALISEMHSDNGPDVMTLFIPASEAEVEEMVTFKYERIYDEINRSIMDAQLRYLKNPSFSTSGLNCKKEEPTPAYSIAVDVLCSCDYSTTKMDQLRKSVNKVSESQQQLPVPAYINFVPDA